MLQILLTRTRSFACYLHLLDRAGGKAMEQKWQTMFCQRDGGAVQRNPICGGFARIYEVQCRIRRRPMLQQAVTVH